MDQKKDAMNDVNEMDSGSIPTLQQNSCLMLTKNEYLTM